MNTTAVVILNYNGRELLRQFLPSVVQHTSANIVIADNHSTDGSGDFVRHNYPALSVIDIPKNLGFCGGYNYSLKKVEAEYYVLLNSDVEVTDGWLEPLIDLLRSDTTIAAVQPKILSSRATKSFEYAGAGGGYIDALGYPFCRGRIFDTLEEDNGQYDDTRPVFWATGACLAVRASAFHAMGGFDEDFFAHMEEIDLCWKLHRHGFQVYYAGRSKVYHLGGATLAKSNPNKTYYNFRNGLTLIFKNLPFPELLWKIPTRMMLDWCAAGLFLLTGYGRDAVAVLRAHIAFIGGMAKDYRKRKSTHGHSTRPEKKLIYSRPIVLDYYLLKRRTFGELPFKNP